MTSDWELIEQRNVSCPTSRLRLERRVPDHPSSCSPVAPSISACVWVQAAVYSLMSPWRIRRRLNRWGEVGWRWLGPLGWSTVQGAMWTVLVVMREVLGEYPS